MTFAFLIFLALAAVPAYAQQLRFAELERRYDAVVLVADAQTGRLLGGARLGEAGESRYAPGSLFKLAIAVAAIRSGSFDKGFTYNCQGKDTIGGEEHRCWLHSGHATIGFRDAIGGSCNLYFRRVAAMLTMQEIAQGARAIGMTPSDDNDDLLLTMGSGDVIGAAFTVSPSRMLGVAVALATRGRISPGRVSLAGASYRPLYDGLRACVRTGTGKNAWSRRFTLGGKTGTSEVYGVPNMTAGWFIGFAPFDDPRYAVVVMQRSARGAEAAAIARKALEELM